MKILMLLLIVLLPLAAQADIVGQYNGRDAIVRLDDEAGPLCGMQGPQWRNAFFHRYWAAPIIRGCWRRRTAADKYLKADALVICPLNGRRLEACTYALAGDFINPKTLPQQAELP